MKVLRCLVADDEPIARQIIEKYIQDIPYLELVFSCKNAFEVMEVLERESIDLLFLDINMPKFSGISLLKSLSKKPEVVITTAYSEYAIEGFELSVTDYLLKPFSFERFLQAVLKVKQKGEKVKEVVQIKESVVAEKSEFIFVKSDKKIVKLNFNEINYVEAYGNYIKIYTENMILTSQTLSEFLEKLPDHFLRIHKSYIINFEKLKMIDGNQIILENDSKLPVGKSYRKLVLEKIDVG
ncbi:LytR/AlgR family response regulator transcription factor [Tenacibaculum sp. M341]|uniref:LytR/AlgR family response regulator transcription factor n=1 Tax=Tenacibaculum sp. M341 TaxID=2530339 RepID=UPI0010458A12|nr:LytTR family DNA-binding domain-containing protein [Tenacibaculum sp. M341]TCI94195.1 response regulator transcription factor [Tenacibaculum sp. M341]